jgi:hypothetical protein
MVTGPKPVAESGTFEGCDGDACRPCRLAHYRVGCRGRRGRILIDAADLEAFLATLEVAAVPPGDNGEFRHSHRPSGSPG